MKNQVLKFIISDPLELNLAYIPFIHEGGLFIPTRETFSLGDTVSVELQMPSKSEIVKMEGKVVWITPINALYTVPPGIGIQFMGKEAGAIRTLLEASLNPSMEVGGYTCGISDKIG